VRNRRGNREWRSESRRLLRSSVRENVSLSQVEIEHTGIPGNGKHVINRYKLGRRRPSDKTTVKFGEGNWADRARIG